MINFINDYLCNNNEVKNINFYINVPTSEILKQINDIKNKFKNINLTVTIKYDVISWIFNCCKFSILEQLTLSNITIKFIDIMFYEMVIVDNHIVYHNTPTLSIQQKDLDVHTTIKYFTLEDFTKEFILYIINNYKQVFNKILEIDCKDEINSRNIPQYSNFDDATVNGIKIIKYSGLNGITFDKLGFLFLDSKPKEEALKKYGENHSKILELLDLVYISETSPRLIYTTILGRYIMKNIGLSNTDIINKILTINFLKIPIIKRLYLNQDLETTSELNKYLSEATALRRTNNVKRIIEFIHKNKAL